MSAQAAVDQSMGLSPAHLLDSLNIESLKSGVAALTHAEPKAAQKSAALKVVATPTKVFIANEWQPADARSRSSLMFVAVIAAHVIGVIALASIRTEATAVEPKALQVAIIAAPESNDDLPPPPKVIPQPVLTLPIEPVYLDITQPETAITVQAKPTEPVTTAAAPTGAPKTVSSVEYIREPLAKYPAAARALKQRGTVTLRVLVDAQGHAREVNLHRSSGYRVLDDAARKAVLDAQFKPYMENGQPQPVYVFVPIEFGAA